MVGRALDFDRLEASFRALASANRLRLLALLGEPRTLDRIHLHPSAPQAAGRPQRAISKQAVLQHLRRLEEQGIVMARRKTSDGGPLHEYVADRARLYALVEDMREVARLGSAQTFEPALTVDDDQAHGRTWPEGPKLVLARGAGEGRIFPLEPREVGNRWGIGRAASNEVCLDYDPYVSLTHCELVADEEGYRLVDIPSARNGSSVNWRPVARGESVALTAGDVLRVGRSLLVFRAA